MVPGRCTCGVGGGAVAQLVADHAGEVAADGSLGHEQYRPVLGDAAHGVGHGDSLVEPVEAGVRPPGLAADQRGVGHVDADGDVVHRLCDRQGVGYHVREGDDGGSLGLEAMDGKRKRII